MSPAATIWAKTRVKPVDHTFNSAPEQFGARPLFSSLTKSGKASDVGPLHPKGEYALALARMGFKVFPLREDDPNLEPSEIKKPALEGDWKLHATTDEKQIEKWWSKRNYNIAVATLPDSDLVVIDYDMKEGQNGGKALAAHNARRLPTGLRVKTASGGMHVYLRAPEGVKLPNSVSKVSQHVDIRGNERGGYVVAPGSTIHGKPYKTVEGMGYPKDVMPTWLVRKAVAGRKKTNTKQGEILGDLDTPFAIARAIHWLKTEAPEAVEGAGGNNTTFQVACRVKDFGISKDTCLELLLDHWNEEKAAPAWLPEPLSEIVGNAYCYGSLPVGVADPASEFEAVELEAPAKKPLPPLTVYEWMARDLPEPDWLLGSVISTTTRALLTAPTGLGKTNFSMALAVAIAAGKDFLHWRSRKPAKVLYIDGEMSRRLLRQRIADAVRRLGTVPGTFFTLSHEDIEGFAPFNTPEGRRSIEKVIKAIGGVDLIVFDSIMCLLSGDPKDPEMWGAVMPWMRSLTKRGIGQIWIHHTGIDESRGYGDKTKEWQLDLVMHLARKKRSDTDVSFDLEFPKARQRTPDTRADFATARIALVNDKWVCAVASEFDVDLTEQEKSFLNFVNDFASENTTDGIVTTRKIVDAAEADAKSKDFPTSRAAVFNLLSSLSQKSQIKKLKRGQWLVPKSLESPNSPKPTRTESPKSACL